MEISRGGGGLKSQIFLKKSIKLNWNSNQKPSVGGVWILIFFGNNTKKFTVWIVHGAIYFIQGHLFSKFC